MTKVTSVSVASLPIRIRGMVTLPSSAQSLISRCDQWSRSESVRLDRFAHVLVRSEGAKMLPVFKSSDPWVVTLDVASRCHM